LALSSCSSPAPLTDRGGSSPGTSGGRVDDAGTPGSSEASANANANADAGRAGCNETPSAVPAATWANATGNLAGMQSECGNLTLVSTTTCSKRAIAGVAAKGLWATEDGGKTWAALGTGSGSATITHRPLAIVYDPLDSGVFWESGIYSGGGVYRTSDGGKTFLPLGSISHNDLVSVDLDDPSRKTLLAGGHEQKQTLHRSSDGGQTWTNVGAKLPANAHFSSLPIVIDRATHLVGACGWGSGTCGIWRTTNGGESWTMVSDFAVTGAPLRALDGAIYWPLGASGIAVSRDAGMSFIRATTTNITSAPLIELPDARLVAVGHDHLLLSSDGGGAWTPLGETLPFAPSGVTYAPLTRTFFVWHWDCGNVVLPDAIMSAGFDFTAR
jgi:hypothetical protein